jgi:hypothetical protein
MRPPKAGSGTATKPLLMLPLLLRLMLLLTAYSHRRFLCCGWMLVAAQTQHTASSLDTVALRPYSVDFIVLEHARPSVLGASVLFISSFYD